ncbi:MAG: tetratricopeptide repeat protein [Comamonadaceae bacterium]|jgi:Flp pilus assembly protein TadD/ketosteroid isomerase-like protein|nr:tetratricopeptide repeat protein [Comamonadaceae bacterium]
MPVRTFLRNRLRALSLAAALLAACAAHADDYGNVNQLVRSGKLAEAQAKAEQYLEGKPRDPQMRFLKGVIQTESGKTADAIQTFTRLTEDYPELPEPYNNLAVLYAGQGQYDKARAALEMAIRTNPNYATAYENLGDVYARLAGQAYSKALQLDGSNATVAPKLTLLRDLFTPGQAALKGSKANAAPTPAPAPAASESAEQNVTAAVQAWAQAWASKDIAAYLGAYGKDFTPPGQMPRAAWEQQRRERIANKASISVKVQNLQVQVQGDKAQAHFLQDYQADQLSVSNRKTLQLARVGGQWLIVKEATSD